MSDMSSKVPKSGEFLEGKLWFQRKGNFLTLGVTSHAIDALGSVESIELPDEGDDFDKGDAVVTVEGTHGRLEVVTPAAGLIEQVNSSAADEPDVVSEDPLEEGWLVKLEIQDPTDLAEFLAEEKGGSDSDSDEDEEDEDEEYDDEDEDLEEDEGDDEDSEDEGADDEDDSEDDDFEDEDEDFDEDEDDDSSEEE